MSGTLKKEDLDNIRQIAKDASEVSYKHMEKAIKKCVKEEFDSVGMGDRDKVRKIMFFGEQCMNDKQNMRRGFWNGLGGQLATVAVAVAASLAAIKGFGN